MQTRLGWALEVPGLFCATWAPLRGSKRHLVVEALPEGGWDWVTWANDGTGRCLHGRAGTQHRAMEAAERGAMLIAAGPVIGGAVARHQGLQSPAARPN